MNFLQETCEDITRSGHTPDQIVFIGSEASGHQCTWEEFQLLANIEYDDGFGAQEIAIDLIIVFKDGAKMWRHGYDGSECWRYSKPFKLPHTKKPIQRLRVSNEGVGWCSLAELNP